MELKVLYICLLVFNVVYGDECDPSQCSEPPPHYSELNCNPIIVEGECCPSNYKCPDFTKYDTDKCYINNKIFNRGDKISNEDVQNPCKRACYCDEITTPARLHCAYVECPEFLGQPGSAEKEGCIKQQSFDSCCTQHTVCEDDEIAELATCELDGKTYREGQGMYPESHPCYSCICGKGFNSSNILNSTHCKKQHCGIDHYMHRLQMGCVPIYYGTKRCCPISWRCPNKKDSVIASDARRTLTDTDAACVLGSLRLAIGDSLNQSDEKISCKCVTPPVVNCVQEEYKYDD